MLALQIGADDRGVPQRNIACRADRDLAGGAELVPADRRVEGDDRVELIGQLLLDRRDDHLARMDGNRDAVDLHFSLLSNSAAYGLHWRQGCPIRGIGTPAPQPIHSPGIRPPAVAAALAATAACSLETGF